MSDDLISRKAVIEAVDRHTREDGTLDDDITVILEEVETAFDKETVIAQMMKERNEAREYKQESAMIAHEIDIEIVKKGGIE